MDERIETATNQQHPRDTFGKDRIRVPSITHTLNEAAALKTIFNIVPPKIGRVLHPYVS
jgi:hypothetical protein